MPAKGCSLDSQESPVKRCDVDSWQSRRHQAFCSRRSGNRIANARKDAAPLQSALGSSVDKPDLGLPNV